MSFFAKSKNISIEENLRRKLKLSHTASKKASKLATK